MKLKMKFMNDFLSEGTVSVSGQSTANCAVLIVVCVSYFDGFVDQCRSLCGLDCGALTTCDVDLRSASCQCKPNGKNIPNTSSNNNI